MVRDEELDEELGIYSIESECHGEDWIPAKRKRSLKLWLIKKLKTTKKR